MCVCMYVYSEACNRNDVNNLFFVYKHFPYQYREQRNGFKIKNSNNIGLLCKCTLLFDETKQLSKIVLQTTYLACFLHTIWIGIVTVHGCHDYNFFLIFKKTTRHSFQEEKEVIFIWEVMLSTMADSLGYVCNYDRQFRLCL